MKQKTVTGRILYVIFIIILLVIAKFAYDMYKSNDFGNFVRSESTLYVSNFSRDKEVRYSDKDSYRIQSPELNDAMFYEEINVLPNTPYKVTCMVKTENVVGENDVSGANICIEGSTERSIAINGTNEWTQMQFLFNSRNRETVKVGFRLGGYDGDCKGTAWFSNLKIESGINIENKVWNMACFIFENIDTKIEVNNKTTDVKSNLVLGDIEDVRSNMNRLVQTCKEFSLNNMTVDYDLFNIKEALDSLDYDETNGVYVSERNIYKYIEDYINKEEYDHIFVVFKLKGVTNPVDWVGLGGMDYYGIGLSNIRLSDGDNYTYKYDTRVNTFPEEVFLHEFLHSLERNMIDYGYSIPELHDYGKYNYTNERLVGYKKWYRDYMQCNIKDITTGNKIGLDKVVYTLKPVHNSNFEYSHQLTDVFEKNEGIVDDVRQILKNVINLFTSIF